MINKNDEIISITFEMPRKNAKELIEEIWISKTFSVALSDIEVEQIIKAIKGKTKNEVSLRYGK